MLRLVALLAAVTVFADGLLNDPNLATFGQPDSPWQVLDDTKGQGDAGTVQTAGKAVRMTAANRSYKLAGIVQTVDLPAGLYELTATASGRGRLALRIGDFDRLQPLGGEAALYGLLVDWPGGQAACAVGALGGLATVSEVQLQPATPAQQALWARQEKEFATFGYIATSAQRPTPGSAPSTEAGDVVPLAAMTDKIVFFDRRMDFAVQVTFGPRVIDWFAANGFTTMDADEVADWMKAKVAAGAYGSVVVFVMGRGPQSLGEMEDGRSLWMRYLYAGGRIVWGGTVPFYAMQSTTPEPVDDAEQVPSLRQMGLQWGWGQPYWGRNPPVTMTEQGRAWGLESTGSSITGFPAEQVSIPFSTYDVDTTGGQGAASWMLNFNPRMPWSGMVLYTQGLNGNSNAALRDLWRLAHYVGTPIADFPELPPPTRDTPPALVVTTAANGLDGRTQFVRGETVSVAVTPGTAGAFDRLIIDLRQGDTPIRTLDVRSTGDDSSPRLETTLDTAPYAFGDYVLHVATFRGDEAVAAKDIPIGIRRLRRPAFTWEIWTGVPANDYQADMILADIRAAGFDIYGGGSVRDWDYYLKYERRASYRLHADGLRRGETWQTAPQKFIRDPDGDFRRHGDRPAFGISHPDSVAVGREQMMAGMEIPAKHPAFSGYILTNDDYSSLHYGIDYSEYNVGRFAAMTGQEPARERPAMPMGVVDDYDPWLMWCLFTLREVSGGWNQMQKLAVTAKAPGARIGPIPGGMQIPLIHMWPAGQYPPLNFGDWGHNLICCYYYNSFWQPLTTNTCWLEAGRMGNRELPEFLMPDVMRPLTGYTRNNLYHLLAGGADGLSYFIYGQHTPEAWTELKHQGPTIRRLGPVQVAMQPTGRRIALMHSVTSDIFNQGNWLLMPYAYANLIQAHYDVDIVAEEEILAGAATNYDAVLLYRTTHLRRSVVDALAAHAANGGLVLVDRSVRVDIPGATTVPVDWAMGGGESADIPPDGAHAATPGPNDYGHPDRIAAVAAALGKHVPPPFTCPDDTLVAHPFTVGAGRYLWLVNAMSGEEYSTARQLSVTRTPEAKAELIEWDRRLLAAQPTFTTTLTFADLAGIPYDLCKGERLAVEGGTIRVSMERLGGTLLAFLPAAVQGVDLAGPQQGRLLQELKYTAKVVGADGPIDASLTVIFTLTRPDGEVSRWSTNAATVAGAATFAFTPAINDPVGTWVLTATEIAANTTTTVEIDIQ